MIEQDTYITSRELEISFKHHLMTADIIRRPDIRISKLAEKFIERIDFDVYWSTVFFMRDMSALHRTFKYLNNSSSFCFKKLIYVIYSIYMCIFTLVYTAKWINSFNFGV